MPPRPASTCSADRCHAPDRRPPSAGRSTRQRGTLPLYNVIVYVLNAPLEPFKPGIAMIDAASSPSGHPAVSAVSDTPRDITPNNVPVGKDIPLVAGRQRRRAVTIPNVTACQQNVVTDADHLAAAAQPAGRRHPRLRWPPRVWTSWVMVCQDWCRPRRVRRRGGEQGHYLLSRQRTKATLPIAGPPNMRESTQPGKLMKTLAQHDMTLLSW